jgi:hypothetical protein
MWAATRILGSLGVAVIQALQEHPVLDIRVIMSMVTTRLVGRARRRRSKF